MVVVLIGVFIVEFEKHLICNLDELISRFILMMLKSIFNVVFATISMHALLKGMTIYCRFDHSKCAFHQLFKIDMVAIFSFPQDVLIFGTWVEIRMTHHM